MNRNLDAEAYCSRCVDSYNSYQFDQSVIFCKRALTIKPNDYRSHFRWGWSLNGKNSYKKSVRKHKGIILRDPKNHVAYNHFGLALEGLNKLLEAEIQYKKSIEIDPSYHNSLHNMAILLTKQGRYQEALEKFAKNLLGSDDQDIDIASTYNCCGFLKFILGKYEEAIESFEISIQEGSQCSMPFLNKSLSLYCLGQSELSLEFFQETLEKLKSSQTWYPKLQNYLLIYMDELSRFKELFESDDLGEINRDKLIINIKGLEFFVDLFQQELAKPF